MTTWYSGKVIQILDESPTTKRFFIEVQDVENFEFLAGQFITFDLPIGEKRLQRWRSYSIANEPNGTNIIELCIVRLKNGLGTTYLFEEVSVGSFLKFKGPDGNFCLPETIDKDIVLVCTGTGVAPFRSVLHDIFSKNKVHKKIHLIFGCRHSEDILYRAEFEQFATQYPEFQYNICLSREIKEGTTQGHVHRVYIQTYARKDSNVQFYLCGWSKMIDEAVENLLLTLGYERNQVKYELYG
jgi:CDP-4-dehydro-6-deoxyglucose reductase